MQTLNEYMESLTVKEHARMFKVFVEGVPISRSGLHAVRTGENFASIAAALKIHELSGEVVDPKSMTKPGMVWEQLDAYYAKKKTRKAKVDRVTR